MRIALCDDSSADRALIRNILVEYEKARDCELAFVEYDSGKEIISALEKKSIPDIILLDINMNDMDGLETASRIRQILPDIPIILVTAYMSYALDGYKVKANRFLIKDDMRITLPDCMDDILEELCRKSREIVLDFTEGMMKIKTDDVIYLESFGHKVVFHLMDRSLSMNRSISDMECDFRKYGFCRVHKSYLVNLRHVTGVGNYIMKLDSGEEIPVPRSRYAQVKGEYAVYRGGML